jgi:hypothetical protein
MPVIAAPLFGFSLGVIFAWAAATELSRSGGNARSRSLIVVGAFGLLVYAPTTAYFPAYFPDWAYAYFSDSSKRSPAIDIALLLSDAASPALGFLAIAPRAAAGRSTHLARTAAIPTLIGAAFLFACLGRLRVHATYAEFHGDFGTALTSGGPIGWALVWMSSVVAAAAAWTVHVLRRFGDSSGP